ncbi:MAG: TonB family protein [Flavobacteriales bacterium]|nr:TonB family protein [Flavobacteriales bacterium]
MEALIYYLKANLVFMVLFAIYQVALRGETWFHARRAWLLATALFSLLLPLLPQVPAATPRMMFELPLMEIAPSGASGGADWMLYGLCTHIGISIALVLWLGLRFLHAFMGLKHESSEARSFFRTIRVPAHAPAEDRDALLAHERVHAEQGHSFDVVTFELIAALFWSNPLWRSALRELRLVHEHTADSLARASHTNYPGLLLAHALGVPSSSLLNTFGSSNLETRMTMLHNSRSPRLARRKMLLALPALLLATMLVSWQAVPTTNDGSRTRTAHVFLGVDQQPEFPGGMEALVRYLQENLRYPKSAMEAKAEGTVHVSFKVKADGQIAFVSVKRGVRKDLDDEALRVVNAMPAWKPGISKGKTVEAEMVLPISFRLGEEK